MASPVEKNYATVSIPVCSFCSIVFWSVASYAIDNDRHYIGLHFENDVFADTDRYYTHATRFDFLYPMNRNPEWLDWYRKLLPDAGNRDTVIGLYLAQYIYTPPDITVEDPPKD